MTNPTWDAVKAILAKSSPRGLTNRQIAGLLDADMQQVTLLTNLIWKAGEIDREQGEQDRNQTIVYFVKR